MTIERGAQPSVSAWRAALGKALPLAVMVAAIGLVWYAATLPMNSRLPNFPSDASLATQYLAAWSQERPLLPAPHQVIAEIWKTTMDAPASSRRSLIFHGEVTLSATLLGFALGAVFGALLAIAIVHLSILRRSLMPWIIASQTVPILAVAPIIIVVLGSVGIVGLLPKSIISAYLCFFPVAIGMVKGLQSPDTLQQDLMRTYSASKPQTFFKLRLPASAPFAMASLKIAVSIALVGAIVGELPTGAQAGLGARLLAGSYYGQTLQIWAALFAAGAAAAALVSLVGACERATAWAMGARR